MTMLEKLRARLKERAEQTKALLAKDALEAAEIKQLGELTTEIEATNTEITALETAEKALASISVPGNQAVTIPSDIHFRSTGTVPAQPADRRDDVKVKVGLLALSTAVAKQANKDPLEILKAAGHEQVADEFARHTARAKSLTASTAVTGGILVPDYMSEEIIEFLRPETAFLNIPGLRRVPMPNGSYSQPGGATGSSASYGTELSNAQATEPTFRDISMVAKELKALVPMSNQFLTFSIAGARAFVEADLRDALTEAMDVAMFRGDGMQGRPLGLYNIPGIGTGVASNTHVPTIAQVDTDLRNAINYLVLRNLSLRSAAWVIGRRALGYLQDLRDANSNFVFPSLQLANPTLKGLPVLPTTNLPENLGVGGNEGVISLIAGSHVLFGETTSLEFKASDEAAYYDAGGTLRSTFQRGETLILGMMRHDVGLRHLPAVYTMTGVKYGAAST